MQKPPNGCVTSEDLEATVKPSCQSCEDPTPFDDDLDPDLLTDFHDARELLRRAKVILDYVSDETVLKTVSKRERTVMAHIAKNITSYLDEINAKYDEGDE